MNQASYSSDKVSNNIYPTDLLEALSNSQADGCLQVFNDSIIYLIYLHQGKLTYATHSVEPFERLERHLRRLSHEVPSLTTEVRTEVRLNFEGEWQQILQKKSDYLAICWLVEQKYLSSEQAQILVKRLIEEVFETYLLLPSDIKKNFVVQTETLPIFCHLNFQEFLDNCDKKLKSWQEFLPEIYSSYQRPYLFTTQALSEQQQKLGKILRGFNFRQLSALFNQDELVLLQKLSPLINSKTVVIREPQPPFDLLPIWKVPEAKDDFYPDEDEKVSLVEKKQEVSPAINNQPEEVKLDGINNSTTPHKQWKIACIDDSKTILNEIERFLDNENFSIFTIEDPLKALMKIIRIQPDIILLDVGMPNIDGYKLCSLIRKYSAFRDTPIIMVTGNKGLIDRAKAKLAGATDYMTKPFTQSDLLTMVFRYLS
jgi:twitching motility two-component system response regulator PilG